MSTGLSILHQLDGAISKARARAEDSAALSARAGDALTAKAIDAYDKAAAKAEADLLKDPDYNTQLDTVERLESTVSRAEEKLALAKADEVSKGEPYRQDPFFTYLQKRGYGTKTAKGWFLTKWLDSGVARLAAYRQAAENYRLTKSTQKSRRPKRFMQIYYRRALHLLRAKQVPIKRRWPYCLIPCLTKKSQSFAASPRKPARARMMPQLKPCGS